MKRILIFFSIFLCGIFDTVYGFGYIHYGRVELHPNFGSRGLYTSNLNQTTDNKQAGFLTENKLGLGIFWPGNVHLLSIDYGLNLYTFPKVENIDKLLYPKNSADLLFELNFPGGIYTKLNDFFLQTLSPASGEEAGVIERTQNTAGLNLGYKSGETFNIGLGYTNVIHDYLLDLYNDLDRMEQSVGPVVYFKIFNKTSLLIDYKYGIITYKNLRDGLSRDSNQHDLLLGITGKLTSKLTYELKAGVESRKYKDSSLEGFSTPIAGLSLIVQPSSLWGIDLKFVRRAYESNWGQNYYFYQNRTDLSVNWYPTSKITTTIGAGYEFNQYNTEELNADTGEMAKRTDGVLSFGLDLFYDVQKWLKAGAGYSLRSRNSNFNIWDYSENRISFGIFFIL
jgi:hypothetical protein